MDEKNKFYEYEFKELLDERVKQKLMFDQLLLASPFAVVILDTDQKIVSINDNFTKLFQYTFSETEGKLIGNLVSSYESENQIDKNLEIIYQGQIVQQEVKRRRKDGKLVDVELVGYPVLYRETIIGVYIIYIDISHKLRDSLTGLYNRNYFIESVDKHIKNYAETDEMFSVIVIDIEGFKNINDTLGHIIGDRFLIEIKKRLNFVLDDSYIVSRIDGDEFAVLINNANRNLLLNLAELILNVLSKPYIISKTEIYLNFNVGISTFPKDGTNSENLIRFADAAMHQAKMKSNDRISFYINEISEKIEQKFFLANYLFSAISNNELSIKYQPIFNINDKKIVGAEALLRWDNAVLGQVPPERFIPVAEKTGLIISMGEWVLKEVCNQIKLWEDKGFDLIPISINISVKQLENINFAKAAIEIMNNKHIIPEFIEFEITESVSSGDITRIVKNIKELKRYGIKISMDDFGTGFSSLGQLDLFELDKLKIDKIFIDDFVQVYKRQNLVKSIIAMAKSLNLVTVAEGIETSEQLSHLRGLGCQLGQGFIFSKPLTVEEIEEFFKKDGK
ncbi:EAL domain-containing protein [Sedimentibacter hydroxybenzoicus DSM 7310]|uniref:EAL domain-containing protein n=1 Tax=Sedimentibacter hydroxybenzoicus DSM 7310 TaxID=1123245 RepID=A0A974BH77_SEDHY|nr:EAL domain-containing protein [Sedimentibacter hydroxybenzoicus]NYB72871.1 EAL domain-containing protein [Sedimentibacter hydroxybenzoicus DSM 7310]